VPLPGTILEPRAPENRNVRLCIVASDPVRKRVDFAISVTAELVRRNWSAKLVFIGAPFAPAASSPHVECVGQLQLSNPTDRTRHSQILATSHLMLLPTMGEAFSIARMEAAHFARPSVVTDTGGMPTQIDDGATGLVMPTAATPSAWADAIAELLGDTVRYEAMCRAAHAKASAEFTWLEWGNRMSTIIDEAVAARSPGRRVA
jgi:glycosyltransferase involved in cell wall biosynthesis